ncbi:hypothetical protein LUZ63_016307 [Rhynchospora breviuscula]|uniref:Uncharacterized protein n=1 Tax=Rhynchospora breviuscula TaxID=2022672 RepID=A0A9Q0C173_9POAL|nr:hypothetical protein LUZ63_016307 [Rhynchospora breviuscula]
MEALAAAVFKSLIEKLSSQLWKDLIMFWSLEKECDKTKNMLTVISIVLAYDEAKIIMNSCIHPWISQLQDTTYDVDDFLDDLQIEKQRRTKGKITFGVVSSENQVKFRYKMVRKIERINRRLNKIMEEKRNFRLAEGNVLMEEDNIPRETFLSVNDSNVYGRNEEKVKIINLLVNGKNDEILSVLPIVGVGGVGKTTLAKIVCNDKDIKKHFHPIIWVYASMKFEISKILQKIIGYVSGKGCDVSYIEAKQTKLRTMISGTRFLLVLDGVWNEDATKWDELNTILTCGMKGSKILVTTRSERVANIMGTFDQFQVIPLKFEYCWELFEKRAFRRFNDEKNGCLVKIGKEIVRKCKGLPLAVVHLADLAGSRGVDWCFIRDNDIWQTREYCDKIMPLGSFPPSLLFLW